MAIQPESADGQGGPAGAEAARPAKRAARRKRRPVLVALFVVLGLGGLVLSGVGISRQVMPRTFTAAQRRQIQAWEIARRWRVTPKTQIFPVRIRYKLRNNEQLGSSGALTLTARRLEIARQAGCVRAAAADRAVILLLDQRGCQALLRATYTDASSSLVLTVGVAVLRSGPSATTAALYLSRHSANGRGAVTVRPMLRPVSVSGTPAAAFGTAQRQISWAVSAGPYLVVATVGYADGRPHQPVTTDTYAYLEMTSLAGGVATAVATPLGAVPPPPRCPGAPAC